MFSEFRTQGLCVDFALYDVYKTELLMASVKFSFEDFPQFLIQAIFLYSTKCGQNNESVMVYMSILCSLLSAYTMMIAYLILYLY